MACHVVCIKDVINPDQVFCALIRSKSLNNVFLPILSPNPILVFFKFLVHTSSTLSCKLLKYQSVSHVRIKMQPIATRNNKQCSETSLPFNGG